ncbi:unnamed protein product [Taenia asiatica]|uniref:Uncharacterized protein n=1 Tax=Taenia asiatica TaxID=60517 RepID=A0A0R3VTN1_TAEAS|nr:unnamed protein product [Taenia asiatica]
MSGGRPSFVWLYECSLRGAVRRIDLIPPNSSSLHSKKIMSDHCSNYRTPSDSDNESILTLSASTEGTTDCETDSSVWSELEMTIGFILSDVEDDLEEWRQGKKSFTNAHARQSGSGGPDSENEATSNEHGYRELESYNFESDSRTSHSHKFEL